MGQIMDIPVEAIEITYALDVMTAAKNPQNETNRRLLIKFLQQ